MATPHADHLNVIKTWRTDPIEQANKHLEKVSSNLADIATINRRVAADLGLEGTTARSASSRLDKLATRLLDGSQKVKQLAEVQHKALGLGKKAQSDNEEIQKNLKEVNSTLKTGQEFAAKAPVAGPSLVKDAQAERDSAHAEVDRQAKNVLRVLRESTEALAHDFPFQDNEPASRHASAPADAAGKGNGGANGSANGSDIGPTSGAQVGPTRSATAWHTPDSAPSIGGPGSYTSGHLSPNGMPSDGPTLQGSHYAPSQLGGFGPSNSTHSPAHPSAVFNPLAAAATIGGGTAVAGYKAYQAMRAARAAQASSPRSEPSSMRSGAAIRSTPPSSASIVRGATTAVRSTTPSAGARSDAAWRRFRGCSADFFLCFSAIGRHPPGSDDGEPGSGTLAVGSRQRNSAGRNHGGPQTCLILVRGRGWQGPRRSEPNLRNARSGFNTRSRSSKPDEQFDFQDRRRPLGGNRRQSGNFFGTGRGRCETRFRRPCGKPGEHCLPWRNLASLVESDGPKSRPQEERAQVSQRRTNRVCRSPSV
mgnify:CR=1 FL=1